jgi:hypothetical protein
VSVRGLPRAGWKSGARFQRTHLTRVIGHVGNVPHVFFNRPLVSVPTEGFGDSLSVDVVDYRRSTEISLPLVAHSGRQMAGAAMAMFGFTLGSEAEPLLGSLVGFLFWHDIEPNPANAADSYCLSQTYSAGTVPFWPAVTPPVGRSPVETRYYKRFWALEKGDRPKCPQTTRKLTETPLGSGVCARPGRLEAIHGTRGHLKTQAWRNHHGPGIRATFETV